MTEPDFESARQYALHRLEKELPPILLYHCVEHTARDVVPAVEWLAEKEGIQGEDHLLLMTAAWFHDLGYTESFQEHEAVSQRIAAQVLPRFGYTQDQIEIINGIIAATKVPQSPTTQLEQIMADADLDNLGRQDFFDLNQVLYIESLALGNRTDPVTWLEQQIDFLEEHTYFTASAQKHRQPIKQQHIDILTELFREHHP